MLPTLIYLPHSPWSLKALCAVRHRQLLVEPIAYRPFLDDPATRIRLARAGARWTGPVSVPILIAADAVALDSWEVARYADEHGKGGERLFPEADLPDIQRFNAQSERILGAGRALLLLASLDDEHACRELVPPTLSNWPMPLLRASLKMFNRKYGIREEEFPQYERCLTDELDGLRDQLGDREYLTGRFSYADIAIGLSLQVVQPLPGSYFGPASERITLGHGLAERYPELLAWRDQLHARHGLFAAFV